MGEKKSTFSLNKDLQSLICTVRCSFWQPTFFMSPDYVSCMGCMAPCLSPAPFSLVPEAMDCQLPSCWHLVHIVKQQEKKKKKGSEAVLHHKDCTSPDSSTVPWMPLCVGPPHHMTACCWLSLSHWEAANLTVSQKAQCYCGYWWFYRFCHSLCITPLYILMTISDHSSQGTKVVFPSGG